MMSAMRHRWRIWAAHGFAPATVPSGAAANAPSRSSPSESPVLDALALSARVSAIATLLILVPGVLMGVWLARTASAWRGLVEGVCAAPLVLPPVVTGFLLLIVLQTAGSSLLFTWWAAVLASAVVAWPLLVRTVRAAVEQIDPRLAVAAATLGASRWKVLRTITVPLAWRGIVGAATLAWGG